MRSILALLILAAPALADDDVTTDKSTRAAVLHAKKRDYLQAKLDAARERATQTRIESVTLIASSVAIPVVTIGGALAAFGIGAAVDQPEAGMVAGAIVAGMGGTLCWLSPYALLTGLSRVGDAEDVEREVAARENMLIQHEARPVRF